MNNASARLILGYHGCSRSTGEKILTRGVHLNPSVNKYDWLGTGVYFWEWDDLRALEFAEEALLRIRNEVAPKPFVLGAVIELRNCLDLLQRDNLMNLRNAYLHMEEAFRKEGKPLPENRPARGRSGIYLRDLDCAVINSFHTYRQSSGLPPYDTVRAAFFEGEPIYPSAGFQAQSHVQICVRNPECIKGYFRPLAKTPPKSPRRK